MICLIISASSVNFVRLSVLYGVAMLRVTSESAMPIVLLPRSRPSSLASEASSAGSSSMGTRRASVMAGVSTGFGFL